MKIQASTNLFKMAVNAIAVLFLIILLISLGIVGLEAQSTSSSSSVSTSSSTSTTIKKTLTTTVKKGTQSIFDNSVPIIVQVTTNFDIDRLEVETTYSKSKYTVKDTATNFFTKIKSGESKTFEYAFTPLIENESKILFKVQAWQNDINIIDIQEIDLKFDKSLQISPQSDEYKQNLKNWNTIKLLIYVVVLLIFLVLGYMFYKSFRIWMSKD